MSKQVEISKEKPKKRLREKEPLSISVRLIIVIFVTLIVGVVSTLLVIKATAAKPENFSTEGLISFVIGIALSAASTILAIEAISLGRYSEQAIIERSDESIKLQTEVFTATMEALTRIEASTGVTEKRIEDIIAGRVGAISERITENLLDEEVLKNISAYDPKTIQNEILESIKKELKAPTSIEDSEERKKMRQRAREKQRLFKEMLNKILLHIANLPTVETQKIGEGDMGGTGEDLVDGIFDISGKKISVSIFQGQTYLRRLETSFKSYLNKLASEITIGNLSQAIVIFLDGEETRSEIDLLFEGFRLITREEISNNLFLIIGSLEEVMQELSSQLGPKKKK